MPVFNAPQFAFIRRIQRPFSVLLVCLIALMLGAPLVDMLGWNRTLGHALVNILFMLILVSGLLAGTRSRGAMILGLVLIVLVLTLIKLRG